MRNQVEERAGKCVKYVEWNDEDECFIGRCPSVFGSAWFGLSQGLRRTLRNSGRMGWTDREGWSADAEERRGEKIQRGKFVVRVEPALHRRLAAKALASGESLNSLCVKALAKA